MVESGDKHYKHSPIRPKMKTNKIRKELNCLSLPLFKVQI